METLGEGKILRIYISNTDKFKYSLLYEAIVFAAKRYGMAGATVLKGIMGYGSSSVIHSVKFWELTEKLPLVIEIVDEANKVDRFTEKIIPWLQKSQKGCLVTVDKTEILLLKHGKKKNLPGF